MDQTRLDRLQQGDVAEFTELVREHHRALSSSNARVLLHRARAQVFKLVDHYRETGEC